MSARYACEFCTKDFSTKKILKEHQKKAAYCLEKQAKWKANVKSELARMTERNNVIEKELADVKAQLEDQRGIVERNMILEKWAIINLNSSEAEMLEKKIRVPKKISNFRKTLNEVFKITRKKKINEKKILSSLGRMNAFRNELDLLNSLDLLQKLKIISTKQNKNWKFLLNSLKKIKVKTLGLNADQIKEKIYFERLKVIKDNKNDL